jgi:hypothetical protein
MVDDQTGDLIFRVTIGPVAGNLLGQRLPAGTGIAGRAVQTRAPVIENDAQRSTSRFTGTDKQTGFTSRSLLAVPMQIKDRVLGVIEVINRRDGLPFVNGRPEHPDGFCRSGGGRGRERPSAGIDGPGTGRPRRGTPGHGPHRA